MAIRDEKGRFIKGISGNPGGRSTISLTKTIKEKLAEGETLDQIADMIINKALEGNEQVLKFLWERIDGKLKESIDLNADVKVNNFAEWVKKVKEENDG